MKTTTASRKHLVYAVAVAALAGTAGSLAAYADRHADQDDRRSSIPLTGTTIENEAVARAAVEGGCSYLTEPGDSAGPSHVVLLSRTGAMAGALLPNELMDDIVGSAGGGSDPIGSLTVVLVGGDREQPRVVVDRGALTDPTAGDARRTRLGATLDECLTGVLDAMPRQREDGSDELLALQVAARLASAGEGGSASLAVVSDGEANAGILDLRTMDYPTTRPARAVKAVVEAGQLPRLEGIPVVYYGIGQNRDEADRGWLADFHSGLCAAADGESCAVRDSRVPLAEVDDADVPADPPLLAVASSVPGLTHARSTYVVDAAVFRPDSTEFAEPAKVRASLGVVRQAVAAGDVRTVLVVGNACDDGSPEDGLRAISEARAERVADALRSGPGLGRVEVLASGRGADVPVAGPSADGTFSSADCARNRRVEITLP